MAHSMLYFWAHVVWHTKDNVPFLIQPLRAQLIHHIIEYAARKGIIIDRLNGYDDHLHCLFRVRPHQAIGEIVGQIKGESSHWINYERLTPERFAWQNGYGGFSVSLSHVPYVRRYVERQEERHRTQSFDDEMKDLERRSREFD